MKQKVTQKLLRAPLKYWQKRLGLQDWEVKIKLVDEINYNGPDYAATCEVFLQMKTATIMMRKEDETPEQTLVHELLHIHLRPIEDVLERNSETYLQEFHLEQFIETMAKALANKDQ